MSTPSQPEEYEEGTVVISTDGSTLRNGQKNAHAGYGGYFGPGHKSNFGLPLMEGSQTNNRAELMAIYEALKRTPLHQNVVIRTDSDTSKRCLEGRYHLWRYQSFKKPKGQYIENEDVIKDILEITRWRTALCATTTYKWIRGHIGDPGNEAADKLAKKGAKTQMRLWYRKMGRERSRRIDLEERRKKNLRYQGKEIEKRLEAVKAKLAKLQPDAMA